jgi:hypothetical protein
MSIKVRNFGAGAARSGKRFDRCGGLRWITAKREFHAAALTAGRRFHRVYSDARGTAAKGPQDVGTRRA